MLEIRMAPDCGNAPKRQFLLDFTIAMGRNDTEALAEAVCDDVLWRRVGGPVLHGRQAFIAGFPAGSAPVTVLTVHTVLTHGSAGSISGAWEDDHGNKIEFCDVHEFTGHSKTARLKKITSYWIPEPI